MLTWRVSLFVAFSDDILIPIKGMSKNARLLLKGISFSPSGVKLSRIQHVMQKTDENEKSLRYLEGIGPYFNQTES